MKPPKILNYQALKRHESKTTLLSAKPSPSPAFFSSSASQPTETLSQDNSASTPPITQRSLQKLIQSSQWHLIKRLEPKLTPSLISTTLYNLHETPQLVLEFIGHIEFHRLDLKTCCLAIAIVARLPSPKPALQLLERAISSGVVTIRVIFDELALVRDSLGITNSIAFDLLIRAFCDLKRADEAFECFDMMKEKGVVPKIETCNDMLSLLLKLNKTQAAWVLYAEMFRLKIKSSVCTFNIMINVLCKEGKLKKAKEFIGLMEGLGVKPNIVTYNTLIQGFCSTGKVDAAYAILSAMKSKGVEPDSYTYGSLISGMCKGGRVEEASGLVGKMVDNGVVPSPVTYNALIDGYCNKGDLEMAFHYRDEMVRNGIMPTVSTYNLLIHALFMEARTGEADDMMKEMGKKGMVPDAITYNILINGYCRCGDAKKAFSLHDEMLSKGIQPTRATYTSLIHVLNKRHRMKDADDLFEKIRHKGVWPDLIMFNALIDGHCANGNMERAFSLLKEMDRMKVPPDEVTYNTLMQGRCREGKVQEARELLNEMKRRGIKPDYISYNTLISGYSKRGDMKDAFGVRDEMLSTGFNPTLLTYNALIQGLCKNHEGDHAEDLLREMISKGFTLTAELTHSFEILSGVVGILAASVFGQELFLLHFHSADHVGLEGHYHWLLQLIVLVSVIGALTATCFPTSFPAALVLSISVVIQGCWFMIMGITLWTPQFVPKGCMMALADASSQDMRGAVTCESKEADLRAKALANLQFSWTLSGLLIFTACVCLKLAGKCTPRGQSSEYEQLHSRGVDLPILTNGLKPAHPSEYVKPGKSGPWGQTALEI